ncbi:MAG: SpoIID/LytB domain-containing protein [Gemmatimonadaceae bacterium]
MPAVTIPHRLLRVALGSERGIAKVAADRSWHLTDLAGHDVVRPARLDGWGIERRGTRVRAIQADGYASPWVERGLMLVVDDSAGRVQWNARAYRGNLAFHPSDSATVVVNVLDAESYLRGVVPLEMGTRPATDVAAVEAQAVVARSFAFERMTSNAPRDYDLTASELDQVYGGINAETAKAMPPSRPRETSSSHIRAARSALPITPCAAAVQRPRVKCGAR